MGFSLVQLFVFSYIFSPSACQAAGSVIIGQRLCLSPLGDGVDFVFVFPSCFLVIMCYCHDSGTEDTLTHPWEHGLWMGHDTYVLHLAQCNVNRFGLFAGPRGYVLCLGCL